MIRHWFRLLWSRRRSNAAIVAEVSICFLVLCSVAAAVFHQVDKARTPLGYDWRNVYLVNVGLGPYYSLDSEGRAPYHAQAQTLLRSLEDHPAVLAAGFSGSIPYEQGRSRTGIYFNQDVLYYVVGRVTMGAAEALDIQVSEGRWFEEQDLGNEEREVVISRGLARTLFGDASAIGQTIPNQDEDGNDLPYEEGEVPSRIVGVVDNYRRLGEFGGPHEISFRLLELESTSMWLPSNLLIRTPPGSDATVEEDLLRTMRNTVPGWQFRIGTLASQRAELHREQLLLPVAGFVLAGFAVLMVGLGLVGVLWQSVSRRTAEFGLRRALGGARSDIRGLVLGELIALTTVSAAIGAVVFLQAPLLGIVGGLSTTVWIGAVAAAAVFLYSFVLLCGLYPSWLATRVEPARALQYE